MPVLTRPVASRGYVEIADSASLSGAVDIQSARLAGLFLPASFVGSVLTFQACDTAAGTYANIYDDDGSELTVNITAVPCAIANLTVLQALSAFPFIKIRSGTAGTPSTQTGAKGIILVLKG
jgi:hypothetical protein